MKHTLLFLCMLHCVTGLPIDNEKDALLKEITNFQNDLKSSKIDHGKLDQSLTRITTEINKIGNNGEDDVQRKAQLVVINRAVTGTITAVTKFASGEPLKIISGILDVTSITLMTFGGVPGVIAAIAINLLNSIFAFFYSSPSSKPTIDNVIHEALNDFHDTVLYQRMNSFAATFVTVYEGIVAVHDNARKQNATSLSEAEITALNQQLKTFESTALLEDVKSSLYGDIISGNVNKAYKVLRSLNVYCQLTSLVELLLSKFIILVEDEAKKGSSLTVYYSRFIEARRQRDKQYFEFLHLPEPNEGLIASIYQYDPSRYPILRDYMKVIGVSPKQELGLSNGQMIYLATKKWPDYYSYLSMLYRSQIYAAKSINDQSKFILKQLSGTDDNNAWKIENKRYQNYYISARKFGSCMPTIYPDMVKNVAGLSTDYVNDVKRKCRYLCLVNGKCDGCYRNCYSKFIIGRRRRLVSINTVWRFTRVKVQSSCPHYLISATGNEFGPGYLLFVADNLNGNAYLKYGFPGDAGIWKLTINC